MNHNFNHQQNAGFGWNGTLTFYVPAGMAAGRYYVGYIIDSSLAVTEDSEFNNAGLAGITLDVQ